MISIDEFKKHLLGFNVLGCTVRSRDVFCFVAQEDYTEWPDWDGGEPPEDEELEKRLIPFIRSKPEGRRWSAAKLRGFNGILIGFSPAPPKPQVIAAGVSGGVYATGSGDSHMEKISLVDEGGPRRGAILKLKTIGEHLYVAGNNRTLGRREGDHRWLAYSDRIPEPKGRTPEGFDDIDGFDEGDIYAVGGAGDVFHFDGTTFRRCAFPSNQLLTSLCCAADGSVYVGALHGHVFKGRGDSWRQIHHGNMTIPFRDMVPYQGRVFCTSDYGLWVIEGDKLREAPVGPEVKICSGNLSARDGVLLVAGHGGAAFCEDGRWSVIFHSGAMTAAAK
ncbi:hypothetical protein WME75_46105 [Sorangium sp. So ce1014]|uniref:hypothetical protein n=1 Tax=Sorangium sp. So ce1014 TaxID=3133326 RepID=UPI003F6269DA